MGNWILFGYWDGLLLALPRCLNCSIHLLRCFGLGPVGPYTKLLLNPQKKHIKPLLNIESLLNIFPYKIVPCWNPILRG